jgi:hypothetical protein
MTFVKAVNKTPSIEKELKVGLQALPKSDRRLVSCNGPSLRGSVDIDSALRTLFPDAARWDYVVGVGGRRQRDSAVWLEVHSASSSHIDEVLSKLRWLKQWLVGSAPELHQLPARFCWIATGTVSFRRGSPQANKIAEAGLRFPVKHLNLESVY